MDIGEYCDEETYFCQSKVATCSSENSFSLENRFCSCETSQIAVYQNVLHYHECGKSSSSDFSGCNNFVEDHYSIFIFKIILFQLAGVKEIYCQNI